MTWRRDTWPTLLLRSLAYWTGLALLAWLDRDAVAGVHHAAVFSIIVSALIYVWQAVEGVGSIIATSLVAAVSYLSASLAWLAARVASILVSTGSMFSRVWEASRQFYSNVLKPALVWVGDIFQKLNTWLAQRFRPIFDFLNTVRTSLRAFYATFVAPVLDVIDTTRQVLKVLADLHVAFARQLDARLGQLESVITSNFLLVLRKTNELINTIDSFITFDGLMQRDPFLATVERDLAPVWRRLVNARDKPLTDADRAALAAASQPPTAKQITSELREYVETGGGPWKAELDQATIDFFADAGAGP